MELKFFYGSKSNLVNPHSFLSITRLHLCVKYLLHVYKYGNAGLIYITKRKSEDYTVILGQNALKLSERVEGVHSNLGLIRKRA